MTLPTQEASTVCHARRPTFDLRSLFTALLLGAMWSSLAGITSWGSKAVLAVFALTYLFGCWKTRRAVLVVLPAMYLPYAWLFFEWPWSSYRRQWIEMLWQLPGMIAEVILHPTSNITFAINTSLVTLLFFFALLVPARLSLKAAWITGAVVCSASLVNSALCYFIYSD